MTINLPFRSFAQNSRDRTLKLLDSDAIAFHTLPIREHLTSLPSIPHKAKR